MDLYIKVQEIISSKDKSNKDLLIEEINDIIEYSNEIDKQSLISATSLLIDTSLKETDKVLQESMLNAAASSVIFHNIGNEINLTLLESNIFSLDGSSLEHALLILGYSENSSYIKTIKKFLTDSREFIKSAANSAIKQLNKRS